MHVTHAHDHQDTLSEFCHIFSLWVVVKLSTPIISNSGDLSTATRCHAFSRTVSTAEERMGKFQWLPVLTTETFIFISSSINTTDRPSSSSSITTATAKLLQSTSSNTAWSASFYTSSSSAAYKFYLLASEIRARISSRSRMGC